MSALTVTLAADITALKRGMAAASQLVAASARRMSAVSVAGLAGIGKGGAALLESGFASAGTAMNASIAPALADGAAAPMRQKRQKARPLRIKPRFVRRFRSHLSGAVMKSHLGQ